MKDIDLGDLIENLLQPGSAETPLDDVDMDLDDDTVAQVLEGDGLPTDAPQPSQCWGAELKCDDLSCAAGFTSGRAHFKNKFCAACREGIHIPASRVRALKPEMRALYANSLRAGFWKRAAESIGGGEVRLANNTITCDGPWLVVYRGLPPELQWEKMPDEWVVSCYAGFPKPTPQAEALPPRSRPSPARISFAERWPRQARRCQGHARPVLGAPRRPEDVGTPWGLARQRAQAAATCADVLCGANRRRRRSSSRRGWWWSCPFGGGHLL